MNELHDNVLEQRLRVACREMIPRLTHDGPVVGCDAESVPWSDIPGESEVVELDAFRQRPRRSGTSVVVGAAAAVLLVVGAVALLQRGDQPAPSAAANGGVDTGATPAFTFRTPTVSLSAESISVIDGDRTLSPTNAHASSEPSGDQHATLEITWTERGAEQRIFIFFTSDGTNWWATEIRTYDTSSGYPDWHEPIATGTFFTTPLGSAYTGDLDLPNLRITGMTLQAFVSPAACEAPTTPIALVAEYPEIVAPAGGFGAPLQLIDTATCTGIPVANYTFEYTTDDSAVATIADAGWPNNGSMPIEAPVNAPAGQTSPTTTVVPYFETRARVDLQLVAPGTTVIHATARDANGVIVGTADMNVIVTETPQQTIVSSTAPAPPTTHP